MTSSAHRDIEQRYVRAWKKLCITSGKHLLSLHTRTNFNAISHINVILSSPNVLEVLLESVISFARYNFGKL
jgi:hypothetical protein